MGYLDATPIFSGLEDVSATCLLDVSYVKFNNFFSVQLDVSNISDICANTMKIKINDGSYFENVPFSHFVVQSGHCNASYTDQKMYKDMLRRLSHHVLGGRSGFDVFTNETRMSNDVQSLDVNICNDLNNMVHTYSNVGFKTVYQYQDLNDDSLKKIYGLGHILLSYILDASNVDVEGYTDLSFSIQDAYENNNKSLPIEVPYSFREGNIIAVRVTYKSQLEGFVPVHYKCFLRLV